MLNKLKPYLLVCCLGLALAGLLVGCSCGSKATQKSFSSFLPPEEAELGEEFQLDEFTKLRINSCQFVAGGKGGEGQSLVLIDYNWTNISKRDQDGPMTYLLTASQNGVRLEPDLSPVEDKTKLVSRLAAGASLDHLQQAFVLNDDQADLQLTLTGKANTVFIDGKPSFAYPVKVTVALADISR